MAFSANGRTQSALSDINITPLVDVVLVLLLIFMVTAPVLQSGIEVAVPQTRTVNQITEEHVDHHHRQKSERLPAGQARQHPRPPAPALRSNPKTPNSKRVVFVRADQKVPFGAFASVMDAVKQAGITNISIVTRPIEGNTP